MKGNSALAGFEVRSSKGERQPGSGVGYAESEIGAHPACARYRVHVRVPVV